MNLNSSVIRILVVCVLLVSMAPMAFGDTCTVGGTAPNGDTYAGCGQQQQSMTASDVGYLVLFVILCIAAVLMG